MQWAHIVHCGQWRLKGVNNDLAAIQILPAQLAGRVFPSHLSSSKAKQVCAACKGLCTETGMACAAVSCMVLVCSDQPRAASVCAP